MAEPTWCRWCEQTMDPTSPTPQDTQLAEHIRLAHPGTWASSRFHDCGEGRTHFVGDGCPGGHGDELRRADIEETCPASIARAIEESAVELVLAIAKVPDLRDDVERSAANGYPPARRAMEMLEQRVEKAS